MPARAVAAAFLLAVGGCGGDAAAPPIQTGARATTATETTVATTTTGEVPSAAPTLGSARSCLPFKVKRRYRVAVRCRFYTVTGSTLDALAAQIDRGVLDRNDGEYVAAFTDWLVRWRYGYISRGGGCRISAPKISIRLGVAAPRWKRPPGVDTAVVKGWRRFIAALWRHEAGHVRNGLAAATQIERTLTGLEAYPSCKELEAAADLKTEAVLERFRGNDRRYDERTRHGETQGAVLLLP